MYIILADFEKGMCFLIKPRNVIKWVVKVQKMFYVCSYTLFRFWLWRPQSGLFCIHHTAETALLLVSWATRPFVSLTVLLHINWDDVWQDCSTHNLVIKQWSIFNTILTIRGTLIKSFSESKHSPALMVEYLIKRRDDKNPYHQLQDTDLGPNPIGIIHNCESVLGDKMVYRNMVRLHASLILMTHFCLTGNQWHTVT